MVAHTISEMPDYIRDGRKVKLQSGNVGIYNRVTGVILEFCKSWNTLTANRTTCNKESELVSLHHTLSISRNYRYSTP